MDLLSKDIIKQALQAYDGTLVIVSHDRDFLDGLVDKVYEFKDGNVKEHLGGINDFLEKKRLSNMQELERHAPKRENDAQVNAVKGGTSVAKSGSAAVKSEPKLTFQQQKELARVENKKKQRIAKLEEEIAQLEEQMAAIEKELSTDNKPENLMKLSCEYEELKGKLDRKMDEWSSLA